MRIASSFQWKQAIQWCSRSFCWWLTRISSYRVIFASHIVNNILITSQNVLTKPDKQIHSGPQSAAEGTHKNAQKSYVAFVGLHSDDRITNLSTFFCVFFAAVDIQSQLFPVAVNRRCIWGFKVCCDLCDLKTIFQLTFIFHFSCFTFGSGWGPSALPNFPCNENSQLLLRNSLFTPLTISISISAHSCSYRTAFTNNIADSYIVACWWAKEIYFLRVCSM